MENVSPYWTRKVFGYCSAPKRWQTLASQEDAKLGVYLSMEGRSYLKFLPGIVEVMKLCRGEESAGSRRSKLHTCEAAGEIEAAVARNKGRRGKGKKMGR